MATSARPLRIVSWVFNLLNRIAKKRVIRNRNVIFRYSRMSANILTDLGKKVWESYAFSQLFNSPSSVVLSWTMLTKSRDVPLGDLCSDSSRFKTMTRLGMGRVPSRVQPIKCFLQPAWNHSLKAEKRFKRGERERKTVWLRNNMLLLY